MHYPRPVNLSLNEKVALVTGASRGIGRAIAIRLARDGAAVAINYASRAEDARKLAAEIESSGGKALAIQADVGRVAEVVRLFDETLAHFGKLDILVNNAGIMFNKPISTVTEAEFDRIFAVNVKGVFFACQQAATRLVDGGRIINIVQLHHGHDAADLRRLRRHQGRGGTIHALTGQGIGTAPHHGQCRLARTDGNRTLQRRQILGTNSAHGASFRLWPAGTTGRNRRGRGFSCKRRGQLGDRPEYPRERRRGLNPIPNLHMKPKATTHAPEVLAHHRQQLKRDAHLRRFGCDLEAGITFILEQALPLESPVLEIGSGRGRFLVKLARRVHDIATVDISAEEQQAARLNARYHKVEDRIKFVLRDAAKLAWRDYSFGAVVSMNAMHHIKDLRPVLEQMLRLVKPGGKIVLADFSPRGFQSIARAHRAEGKIHPREPHSFRDLQQLLRKRGLVTRLRKGCNQEVLVAQMPAA